MKNPLPFVFVNVAMTADGKIAPANRHFVPFSSKRDQELMMDLRTKADAVMSGAATVMAGKVDLGPGGPAHRKQRVEAGRAEYNIRVIVSGSGSLDPKAHIFTKRFSPIIVLTTERAPASKINALAAVADEVFVSGKEQVDFHKALAFLREKWKVKRLLCEGGGEVNSALFRDKLVDELYLTISPVLFGGQNAPTLSDGQGAALIKDAVELTLKKLERIGDELFLIYRVNK